MSWSLLILPAYAITLFAVAEGLPWLWDRAQAKRAQAERDRAQAKRAQAA